MASSPNSFALSKQEEKVLTLSMTGLGDKEVADEMRLSLGTVRTYWKRIQGKIGGNTRAEIVATYAQGGVERELHQGQELISRLRAELAQRSESEERYRAVCACCPLAIVVMDPRGGCVFVNEAWERLAGRSAATALGDGWRKTVHGDDIERIASLWKGGPPKEVPAPTEFRLVTSRGVIWVRCHLSKMIVNNRSVGFIGTLEDVSDRRTGARSEDRAHAAV